MMKGKKDIEMDPAQVIYQDILALQNPMNDIIDQYDSPVQRFYSNTTVFLTGGSGFIGKQLIEKLLRSCALKKIYLLLRPRKGKTIEERLKELQEDIVYDTLRKKHPDFINKIEAVEGDVQDVRLGMSEKVWNMLANEVNIIFHVAATVRFDEPLRKATLINVRGTREVLALAKDCQNLKHFVHVSTAFAHATKDRIDQEVAEKFYPCVVSPQTLIDLAETLEEERLDGITESLKENWPNTYTFTKSIAEELIRRDAGDLPVCIVKPSIVLAASIEPSPGWLDMNALMGPSGIFLGSGLGIIHVLRADISSITDIVPVDYTNNAIIAAAWDSSERRKDGGADIPIYTIGGKMKYGAVKEVSVKHSHKYMTPKAVWLIFTCHISNKYLYSLLALLLHYIPAYCIDLVCTVVGKKPKGIESFSLIYKKIDKLSAVYEYFIQNNWQFKDDNLQSMCKRMNIADRKIFNCDMSDFDFENYIISWSVGLRKHIVKDGLKDTALANRKQRIFAVLNAAAMMLYAYVLWSVISLTFGLFNNMITYLYCLFIATFRA